MGEGAECEAEAGAFLGGCRWVVLGDYAVGCAYGCAEAPVNAFGNRGLHGWREFVAGDLLGEELGWFGFAVGAGREHAFGECLCCCCDEAAD